MRAKRPGPGVPLSVPTRHHRVARPLAAVPLVAAAAHGAVPGVAHAGRRPHSAVCSTKTRMKNTRFELETNDHNNFNYSLQKIRQKTGKRQENKTQQTRN